MKLSRNKPGLLLHERCIVLPDLEEYRLIGGIECEDVHEHNRSGLGRQLTVDRKGRVKRSQLPMG